MNNGHLFLVVFAGLSPTLFGVAALAGGWIEILLDACSAAIATLYLGRLVWRRRHSRDLYVCTISGDWRDQTLVEAVTIAVRLELSDLPYVINKKSLVFLCNRSTANEIEFAMKGVQHLRRKAENGEALTIIEEAYRTRNVCALNPKILKSLKPKERDRALALKTVYG